MISGGRDITYLRLSVTDRCNLRCTYCMPLEGIRLLPQAEILTYDEIMEVISTVAAPLGLRGIRITGGEPLVRGGVVGLIEQLSRLGGIDDLSLTTNAILLEETASKLRKAGLQRVNISLDTIRPGRYREICRGGSLRKVFRGIDAAERAGLTPIKINQVVIPGVNDDEVEDLARMTIERALHVRFIEFMPIGNSDLQRRRKFISSEDLKKKLRRSLGLEPAEGPPGLGPARYCRIPGAKGTIGFISPLSEHFCLSCNRIRLTADGWVRTCLLNDRCGVDIKTPLRAGGKGEMLVNLFREAIRKKPPSHDLALSVEREEYIRTMCQIGG